MGQKVGKSNVDINSKFIYPLPGTSGYSLKNKGTISVYTDNSILNFKVQPEITGNQLRELIRNKTGSNFKLFVNGSEIDYESTVLVMENKRSLLVKAELVRDSTNDNSISFSSNKSTVSGSRRAVSSSSSKISMENDLSKYAAPEVGVLKNRKRSQIPCARQRNSYFSINS